MLKTRYSPVNIKINIERVARWPPYSSKAFSRSVERGHVMSSCCLHAVYACILLQVISTAQQQPQVRCANLFLTLDAIK